MAKKNSAEHLISSQEAEKASVMIINAVWVADSTYPEFIATSMAYKNSENGQRGHRERKKKRKIEILRSGKRDKESEDKRE